MFDPFAFDEISIHSSFLYILKDTRPEVKEALTKKLEGLKNQQQVQDNLALERKIFLRDRKIKFFGNKFLHP